jgi:cyclophilin family peptidyl-prolyl cis-trans isomerase
VNWYSFSETVLVPPPPVDFAGWVEVVLVVLVLVVAAWLLLPPPQPEARAATRATSAMVRIRAGIVGADCIATPGELMPVSWPLVYGRSRRGLLPATALVATSLAVAGCGGGGDGGKKASTSASSQGKGCARVPQPPSKRVRKQSAPRLRLSPKKTYVAAVETSCGTFELKLDPKQAPRTGGSFVTLARKGFYDNLTFHRIVPGFVIQGGDPRGTGTGGPGYKVRERPPADVVYSEGVAAMAKAGNEPPGTSGSQFFVVTAADANLPPDYALLGEVSAGLDVVKRIGQVKTGPDERPLDPVVIKRIKIETK